jgi:hypothetical protein
VLIGAAATIGIWTVQVLYAWDALERYYLAHYILVSAGWFEKYAVLHTVDARGKSHPAMLADIEPVDAPRGAIPFRLTEAAKEAGAVRLVNPVITVDRKRFTAFLRDGIYHGGTIADLAKPGIAFGVTATVIGMILAWGRWIGGRKTSCGMAGACAARSS